MPTLDLAGGPGAALADTGLETLWAQVSRLAINWRVRQDLNLQPSDPKLASLGFAQ